LSRDDQRKIAHNSSVQAKSRQASVSQRKGTQATPVLLTCDGNQQNQRRRNVSKAIKIKTLALAMVIAASASVAFAQSPPPYWGGYGYPGEGAVPAPAFPIAPYGDANPSYSGYYGTYPAYSWDPDPYLRAQLRSDFNRGVDFPGR
jgi:hypothetical protein